MYRRKEIRLYGEPDGYGVLCTRKERILIIIELLFDSILAGYVIREFSMKGRWDLHKQSFLTYWIFLDVIIMFLSFGYNYGS